MMTKFGLSALVAAGMLVSGLSAGSASAADLGGNCCADLEERIAELEATTARKGNRRVSLTISGWVAEQVMWWDDDETGESNVYVGGLGTTLSSHFKMTGQATIMPGWSAGYVIHVEVFGSETLLMTNQGRATGPNLYDSDILGLGGDTAAINFAGVNTLQSFWFIKSDHLGKVGIGLQSQASDNTAILPDGSGSLVPANFVVFDYGGFFTGGTPGIWGDEEGCSDCNGIPVNNVRYDSPTWRGFSVSASWGEDDFWDVAARYAGEHHGFKLSVAAAYSEATDEHRISCLSPVGPAAGGSAVTGCGLVGQALDSEFFQIGAYAQHIHSGLWIYGAYGDQDTDSNVQGGMNENNFWYIKSGLRRRWHPLGHTVLYGEYMRTERDLFNGVILDSEVDLWGAGVVQEIDAAAMSMWLTYRHLSGHSNEDGPGTRVTLEDFQYVKFGALINF